MNNETQSKQETKPKTNILRDRIPDAVWDSVIYRYLDLWDIYNLVESFQPTTYEEFVFTNLSADDFIFQFDE